MLISSEPDRKTPSRQEAAQARVVCSKELFQGRREIFILHSDQQYRLQITKAGKLILNK